LEDLDFGNNFQGVKGGIGEKKGRRISLREKGIGFGEEGRFFSKFPRQKLLGWRGLVKPQGFFQPRETQQLGVFPNQPFLGTICQKGSD